MSTEKFSVNMHSRLTVVSSIPIEPSGLMYGLTPLDHVIGSHTVHMVFYYRSRPFSQTGRFGMDLDSFRSSLADLLSKYPRMTGRLARDGDGNWGVKCNDAGVRMIKADVGSTIDEWLRFADESDERNLTVWEDLVDEDPGSWSPFRIQINEFQGGGVAIGLSFTHLLADPTSATLFFKSWTDVERGEPDGDQPPTFTLPNPDTRPSNENDSSTTKYYETKSKQAPNASVKMGTATFKFSHETIKQQLMKIRVKCPEATPFDFLAALFWLRIVKLKTPMTHTPTNSLSICVDYRRLLDVPVPTKFFGNALHFSQLSLTNETFTNDDGLQEAVESVHRHVTGFKKEDFFSVIDWLESRKGANGEYPKAFQMYGPELTCVSMDHLMVPKEGGSPDKLEPLVYEAKFKNDEKPVHVSYHFGNAEGEGLILVMPSSECGLARTVRVTLPIEQLVKLNEDRVLLELEPATILSGRA